MLLFISKRCSIVQETQNPAEFVTSWRRNLPFPFCYRNVTIGILTVTLSSLRFRLQKDKDIQFVFIRCIFRLHVTLLSFSPLLFVTYSFLSFERVPNESFLLLSLSISIRPCFDTVHTSYYAFVIDLYSSTRWKKIC